MNNAKHRNLQKAVVLLEFLQQAPVDQILSGGIHANNYVTKPKLEGSK